MVKWFLKKGSVMNNSFYVNNFKVLVYSIIGITIFSIAICCVLYEPLNNASVFLNNFFINENIAWLSKIGYCFQPLTFSAAFSILWILFNNYIWKLIAHFGWLTDINGTWCGFVSTHYGERYCVMIVKQKYTRIHVTCYFSEKNDNGLESSYSTGFNFNITNEGDKKIISFSYKNVNRNNDSPDIYHLGFNFFFLNNNQLDGHYSTFRNDRTYGSMQLKKINKETKYKDSIWKKENFIHK